MPKPQLQAAAEGLPPPSVIAPPNVTDIERAAFARDAGFLPIARNGKLTELVSNDYVDHVLVPMPLPVEDYVVGLELLGFRYQILVRGDERLLFRAEPEDISEAWDRYVLMLQVAFGARRTADVIAYLKGRASA